MIGKKRYLPGWNKRFSKNSSFQVIVLTLLLISQVIIFLPHVGKGFITDDFNWLDSVLRDGKPDILRTFKETTGFFRPLVGITFAIQYQLHGLNPLAFGLFNLFIHLLNIILVFLLLSSNDKSKPYAIFTAFLFAFNAKGVHNAVGWISARTSLLFTFFLLLSFYLYFKIKKSRYLRFFLTALSYFAALLSKETPVITPVFVFVFSFFGCYEMNCSSISAADRTLFNKPLKRRIKTGLNAAFIFIFPLIIYFILRFNSNAMTPFNAPDYYKYKLSPLWLIENIFEYMIRAGLLNIYILLFLVLLTLIAWKKVRKGKSIDYSMILGGLLWFVVFILPELPIPSRSDLYVYFPQIGLHVASLSVIFHLWKNLDIKSGVKRYLAWALIFILSIAWGGYLLTKAGTIAKKGRCSAFFTQQVVAKISTMKPGSKIVIIDRDQQQTCPPIKIVSYGFPALLNIYFPGRGLQGKIVAPQIGQDERYDPTVYYFSWQNGHLTQLNDIE